MKFRSGPSPDKANLSEHDSLALRRKLGGRFFKEAAAGNEVRDSLHVLQDGITIPTKGEQAFAKVTHGGSGFGSEGLGMTVEYERNVNGVWVGDEINVDWSGHTRPLQVYLKRTSTREGTISSDEYRSSRPSEGTLALTDVRTALVEVIDLQSRFGLLNEIDQPL